jgi:hypothetical protein
MMMYDSIRQGKPAIRNSFGVGRFNTRLSFYLFELNRVSFVQRKSLYMHRHVANSNYASSDLRLLELDSLDLTLFSYTFSTVNR